MQKKNFFVATAVAADLNARCGGRCGPFWG